MTALHSGTVPPALEGVDGQNAEMSQGQACDSLYIGSNVLPSILQLLAFLFIPEKRYSLFFVFLPIHFHTNNIISGLEMSTVTKAVIMNLFLPQSTQSRIPGNTVNCSQVTDVTQACHKPHRLNEEQKQAGN